MERGGQLVQSESPEAGIRVLRLSRPEKLNALTLPMVSELKLAFDDVGRDESCRVVILTGAGRGFCAGVDVGQTVERRKGGLEPSVKLRNQLQFVSLLSSLRSIPQPLIAAVNGPAVGIGMALVLASDIRILEPTATLHVGALRIGLTAGEGGMTYLLPRLVGASRAFEILLTGRPIPVPEAHAIGLASRVAEPGTCVAESISIARGIAENSPFGVMMTKRLLWANLESPGLDAAMQLEAHSQMLVSMSADTGEAMSAFLEKRKPVFNERRA
jgi:enoyl-CoA hydratase